MSGKQFSRLETVHTARLAAWEAYQDADRELRELVKAERAKRERENAHAFDCAIDDDTGKGCDCRPRGRAAIERTGDSSDGGFRF